MNTVAIIITTKNRKDDLTKTLQILLSYDLKDIPIYITDDASDFEISEINEIKCFSNIKVHKNKKSLGLIVNRNKMASIASEDILISLDDDSCFVGKPNFDELINFFNNNPLVCGVELNNAEIGQMHSLCESGEILQMYTGFGHAINRKIFLEIGGYREYFMHMCEERDFAMRAWRLGYKIVFFGGIKVLHRRTPVGRNNDRNFFYKIRNTIIYSYKNMIVYRLFWLPLSIIYMLLFWREANGRRMIVVRAVIDAFKTIFINRNEPSTQMNLADIIEFRKKPIRIHK